MAAVAVPPSGWTPIGARELLAHARRNFGQGLVLSAIGHAALLGLILWLYAPDPIIRMSEAPVDIICDPTRVVPPPDIRTNQNPTTIIDGSEKQGTVIEVPEVKFDPATLKVNVGPSGAGASPGTTREPGTPAVGDLGLQAPPLPDEHTVVLRDT